MKHSKTLSIISIILCILLMTGIFTVAVSAESHSSKIDAALQFIDKTLKPNFSLPDSDSGKLNANIYTAYTVYAVNQADKYDYLIPDEDTSETVDALTKTILLKATQNQDCSADGEKLAKIQSHNGGFVNTANVETVSATSFAIVAAKAADAKIDEDKAVDFLSSKMLSDGGYNDYDTVSNVDTTAMAMMSLVSINNDESTKLLEKCTDYVKSTENTEGFYVGKGQYDSANSCSQSFGIIGLVSANEKVSDNAVNALKSLQDENGGFWYDSASKAGKGFYSAPDYISTYESMMALSVYDTGGVVWIKNSVPSITTTAATTKGFVAQTVKVTTNNNQSVDNNQSIDNNTPDDNGSPSNVDDVTTGEQPFNPWFVVILVAAIIIVVLALIPTFKKKK